MDQVGIKRHERPIIDRLMDKVEFEPNTGCWLWSAARTISGYGCIKVDGRPLQRTHRLSWEIHNGPIPVGMYICHKCDTPACINPSHLFLGTHQDNHADRARKGRTHGKLTEEQVRFIRSGQRTVTECAREFGVSVVSAWKVFHKKNYKHVLPL